MEQSLEKIKEMAIDLANRAHSTQKRWDGSPYIRHPLGVMRMVTEYGLTCEIVAVLHDLIEDTAQIFIEELYNVFPDFIIKKVEYLTKNEKDGESYFDYLMRLLESNDLDVIRVKEADLIYNLSDNMKSGSMKDKYTLALYIVREKIKKLTEEKDDGYSFEKDLFQRNSVEKDIYMDSID